MTINTPNDRWPQTAGLRGIWMTHIFDGAMVDDSGSHVTTNITIRLDAGYERTDKGIPVGCALSLVSGANVPLKVKIAASGESFFGFSASSNFTGEMIDTYFGPTILKAEVTGDTDIVAGDWLEVSNLTVTGPGYTSNALRPKLQKQVGADVVAADGSTGHHYRLKQTVAKAYQSEESTGAWILIAGCYP